MEGGKKGKEEIFERILTSSRRSLEWMKTNARNEQCAQATRVQALSELFGTRILEPSRTVRP